LPAFVKLTLLANDSDTGSFVFSEDEYRTEYADPYRWSNLT
jgi:SIR2-like domain